MKSKFLSLLFLFFLVGCAPTSPSGGGEIPSGGDVDPVDPNPGDDPGDDPGTITYTKSAINESAINKQVYLNSLGDIYSVWEKYRGDNVTLAVIDSGFDVNHPEFKDANGNSRVSNKSANFYVSGSSVKKEVGVDKVKITDGDSHGTFCAGVAAAGISGEGVVGIAPHATIMFLKTDKKPKSICEAFKYAADNGARAITISIGSYADYLGDLTNDGSDLTTVFNSAVEYCYNKGVVVCSAAGNGCDGANRPTEFTYPGGTPKVIGVGGIAYNEDETVWAGSSYNANSQNLLCDVFAPGQNMYNAAYLSNQSTYGNGWNGTSFSSPIVAGAACLYFQKYPNKTNVDFENDLYRTAVSMSDSKNTGHGRIDIGALLGETKTNDVSLAFNPGDTWNADGAKVCAYLWNSKTGANNAWPGDLVEGKFTVNLGSYDKLILSRVSPTKEDWNARTISLSLYAFNYADGYELTGTLRYGELHPNVGSYLFIK